MDPNDLKNKTPSEIVGDLPNFLDGTVPRNIIAQAYLQVALNKEMVDSQCDYQDKSIRQMRHLVYATWALVIVTLIVLSFPSISKLIKYN